MQSLLTFIATAQAIAFLAYSFGLKVAIAVILLPTAALANPSGLNTRPQPQSTDLTATDLTATDLTATDLTAIEDKTNPLPAQTELSSALDALASTTAAANNQEIENTLPARQHSEAELTGGVGVHRVNSGDRPNRNSRVRH